MPITPESQQSILKYDTLPERDSPPRRNPQVSRTIISQTQVVSVADQDMIFGLPPVHLGTLKGRELEIPLENFIIMNIKNIGEIMYRAGSTTAFSDSFEIQPNDTEFGKLVGSILAYSGCGTTFRFPYRNPKFCLQNPRITEVTQNEYGSSILESSANFISDAVKDYAYLSGGSGKNISDMINDTLGSIDKATKNMVSSGLDSVLENIGIQYKSSQSLGDAIVELGRKAKSSLESVGKGGKVLAAMLEGYRVDLPSVWKGSSTSRSFTASIKLYSVIDNKDEILRNIIIPYTLLKVLGSPRSNETFLYRWPFVFEMEIPGIVHIPMGVVKTVSFTKPGAENVWTHKGHYISINVEVTIEPLYNAEFVVGGIKPPRYMLTVNDNVRNVAQSLYK